MAIRDLGAQRLHVETDLSEGREVVLSSEQGNYLRNVLRLNAGDTILIFNGRDGEWRARLAQAGKRDWLLVAEALAREQEGGPDIDYLFAPLKSARLDYMVQKATEMGVARLVPVWTRRTAVERVNIERMRANAIEAAEQCGVLRVPEVAAPSKLAAVLASWDPRRHLVVCDEVAEVASPVAALQSLREKLVSTDRSGHPAPSPPLAVLIGPEGGFAAEERAELRARPFTTAISLGPRIMRADTAAVAALALVNAVLGDWR